MRTSGVTVVGLIFVFLISSLSGCARGAGDTSGGSEASVTATEWGLRLNQLLLDRPDISGSITLEEGLLDSGKSYVAGSEHSEWLESEIVYSLAQESSCLMLASGNGLVGASIAKTITKVCQASGLALMPVSAGVSGKATLICGAADLSQVDVLAGFSLGALNGLTICARQKLRESHLWPEDFLPEKIFYIKPSSQKGQSYVKQGSSDRQLPCKPPPENGRCDATKSQCRYFRTAKEAEDFAREELRKAAHNRERLTDDKKSTCSGNYRIRLDNAGHKTGAPKYQNLPHWHFEHYTRNGSCSSNLHIYFGDRNPC